jgi:hypothetical protein
MQLIGGNRSPRTPYRRTPNLLQFLSNSWTRLNTLMVDTQQVVGNNYTYMQLILSKLKVGSILYIGFIDTLATYLVGEFETTKPN